MLNARVSFQSGSVDNTWKQGDWSLNMCKKHSKPHIARIKRTEESKKFNLHDIIFGNNETIAYNSETECWPKDWLPLDFPNARVSAINYDTDPYLWGPIWHRKYHRTNLMNRANKMLKLLTEHRIGVNRPIVWIGHSKGGLYIKQMIVNAYMEHSSETNPIWSSTKSILFYSVPHRGSPLANLNLPFLKQSIEMIEIRKSTFPPKTRSTHSITITNERISIRRFVEHR